MQAKIWPPKSYNLFKKSPHSILVKNAPLMLVAKIVFQAGLY